MRSPSHDRLRRAVLSKPLSTIIIALLVLIAPALILPMSHVTAGMPPEAAFDREWARMDGPVAQGLEARTWVWGPEQISDDLTEDHGGSTGDSRLVRYHEKARMELPDSNDDHDSPGSVQAGALVTELIDGWIQVGDGEGAGPPPSTANVAGDANDPNGLTYRVVGELQILPPFEPDALLTTRVSPDGELEIAEGLADYGVTADYHVAASSHRIASVFWEFLNESGAIWNGVEHLEGPLFPEPLAATGNPITGAYWLTVAVAGVEQDVLLQCFEHRCLTYTPGNPDGWQVESNNAGRHYYDWRYDQAESDPVPDSTLEPDADLPVAVFETSSGEVQHMDLEVAATDRTRACGLMHRTELETDTGMLFVWKQDHQGSFWNCNTFVPLTLAWIESDGIIIGLSDMAAQIPGEPQNVVSYSPPGTYRYVIEANQGWFKEHGIIVGDAVDLDEALARGDTASDTLCRQLGLACN